MSLTERFVQFFADVNPRGPNGEPAVPYPWQCELVRHVASTGSWSDIVVPTGAGKTSVIDMHVFLVAEHASGSADVVRPPRRLVLVAPRRVLVDDQYERARQLLSSLSDAAPDSPLGGVARVLGSLRTTEADDVTLSPIGVWRLRGGTARVENGWRLDPAACQIICTTPQMWGSRLLFRGYGASSNSRNTETGLIAYDAVAVIDEAHLHERLLQTGWRISEQRWGSRRLQVVGMSATWQSDRDQIRLSGEDLAQTTLASRVNATKRVMEVEVDDLRRNGAAAAVDTARDLASAGTVGVFVNDVPTAVNVAGELQKGGSIVALVCGRMRPADLASLRKQRPGLLTPLGDVDVDFLVSTQSLEVGVDLDLPAMVTLLASPNALAQRAGRLNRSGKYEDATFAVVTQSGLAELDPEHDDNVAQLPRSGPYEGADLVRGIRWLRGLDGSIAPARVNTVGLPETQRLLLPALRQADIETLQMTSMAQSADPDVDLYIEDPRQRQTEIRVAARRYLDFEPVVVESVLQHCPPRTHEAVSLSWPLRGEIERLFDRLKRWPDGDDHGLWVVRRPSAGKAVEQVTDVADLYPGDTLIVPDGAPICTSGVIGGTWPGEVFRDVLEAPHDEDAADAIIAFEPAQLAGALELDPSLGSRVSRQALATVLREAGHEDAAKLVGSARLGDVDLWWCVADEAPRGLLVILDLHARASLSRSSGPGKVIPIDGHEDRVHHRVNRILEKLQLDLGADETEALLLAAQMHDEGKRHPTKFQKRMGWEPGLEPLAKPRPGHKPEIGDGWRHEQLSAAYVASKFGLGHLAVVLVAAHHGRGRALFDRDAGSLLDGFAGCDQDVQVAAQELFGDFGRYEMVRAQATREHGAYELAWLEALLRCADVQVSKEEER